MLKLAAPVLAEETLTLMVTWTDWFLTGRYLSDGGDAIKAAMGLMGYTMWLIPSMFAAIAIGATAIIARRVGEQQHHQAQHVANQAIVLGIGLAIIATVAAGMCGSRFIEAMHLQGESAEYARQYLWIILPVIPLIMFEQVGAACLRGAGDTVTGFVAKLIVVIVNVLVSLTLVAGLFGVEPLGWKGIAIGTAVGHGIGGLILGTALVMGRFGLQLKWHLLKPNFKMIMQLLKIGVPGGLDVGVLLCSNLVYVSIINSLGTAAAAAHGLAVQLEACAYLPANAFHVAAATLAGQYLGAKMPERAMRSSLYCIGTSIVVITITAVATYFGGHALASWFTNQPTHPTTIEVARLLKIVSFALPSLAIVMVTAGALRGAGDTIWPMLITAAGFFLVRIPLAIWLATDTIELTWLNPTDPVVIEGWGLGVAGAWTAMAIDLVIRSVMILWRFFGGNWKEKKV